MHQLSADGNSMETLSVTSYDHGIADLALLPDGRTVVVAVKDTPFLHLYDAQELQVTQPASCAECACKWLLRRALFSTFDGAGAQETRKVNMNDKVTQRQSLSLHTVRTIADPELLSTCCLFVCVRRCVHHHAQEWDDTLSFSATTVAVSPCGSFLLVSTDGPRMMVFRTRGAGTTTPPSMHRTHTSICFWLAPRRKFVMRFRRISLRRLVQRQDSVWAPDSGVFPPLLRHLVGQRPCAGRCSWRRRICIQHLVWQGDCTQGGVEGDPSAACNLICTGYFSKADIAAQVVSKLAAHPGSNVRTMVADEAHGKLYTGSFDKSVRVFGSG